MGLDESEVGTLEREEGSLSAEDTLQNGNTLSVGDYSRTQGQASIPYLEETPAPASETDPRRRDLVPVQVADFPVLAVTPDQFKAPIRFERYDVATLLEAWIESTPEIRQNFWPLTIERGVLPYHVEQAMLAISFADKAQKRYIEKYASQSGMLLLWALKAADIHWRESAPEETFQDTQSCRILMQLLARAVGKWRFRMNKRGIVEGGPPGRS